MNSGNIDWRRILDAEIFASIEAELGAFQEAVLTHSPRAIRLNLSVGDGDLPFRTGQVPWYAAGRFVADADIRPGQFLQHAAGDYYVQDAGSMLALALCGVQPGQMVCDTCASPGGKSTGLLQRLAGSGVLVANEVISSRQSLLQLALARNGQTNYLVMSHELERLAELCGSSFDCVLLDAPCTGQSMVARSKQSMSAFSAKQVRHSSARQQRLIQAAARLVRPAGRLVYSTCTYSVDENERIITDFLTSNPCWELLRFPKLDMWECRHQQACYRLWPHRDSCAGAFAAALLRPEDAVPDRPLPSFGRHKRWQLVNDLTMFPQEWLNQNAENVFRYRDELHQFPTALPAAWIDSSVSGSPLARLASNSRTSRSPAASQSWQPLYAAAKAPQASDTVRQVTNLSDQQASKYVAGESIRGEFEGSGWTLVTWRGRALSWGKLAKGVLKNHFPKGLRQQVLS